MKVKTINLEIKQGIALYKQLYQKIQNDILSGFLVKGDQLLSIRKCESLLKISKTSIERAYEMLLDEGYIISIPQKGYFVNVDEEQIKLRKSLINQPVRIEKEDILYDFRSQSMDSGSFDIALWKKYLKDVLDSSNEITTYGNPQGELALRIALQKYAYSIRGVLCNSDQILIGSSFQSLLYILCGLCDKPCTIGMEISGFPQAETVFQDYGFTIKKIETDKNGIVIEDLYQQDIQMLYINSGSHGSDHKPISKEKRNELLKWAETKNAFIIEDDHNGELRYHSKTAPALQGFDIGKHIIYIGSFSKLLLPSLRISYMVFTNDLLAKFEKRKENYSPTSSKIEQLALAHYIVDGHLERHVKKLRKRYEQKSKLMEKQLEKYFPQANCILEEAALQFIMRFPSEYIVDDLIYKARKHKILIQKNTDNHLVISFAAIKENEIEDAIYALKLALQ